MKRIRPLYRILPALLVLLAGCRGAPPAPTSASPTGVPSPAYPAPIDAPASATPVKTALPTAEATAPPAPSPTPEPTMLPPETWPDRFNADSRPIDFSADGRLLLLESDRPLLPGEAASDSGQAVPAPAVYLYDRSAGTYERVTANSLPLTHARDLSPDGRWVLVYDMPQRLGLPGDFTAVYLLDRQTGLAESVSLNSAGEPANEWSLPHQVSADGRFVLFQSSATNLGDSPPAGQDMHTYLRDRQAGTTVQVDLRPDGSQPAGGSYAAVMTPDARFIAFLSESHNMVEWEGACGDDCQPGLIVLDRGTGRTQRIPGGQLPVHGGPSERISLSADGRYVTFHAYQPDDPNYSYRVHVYDRHTGQTETICAQEGGTCAGHNAEISADGRYVAFTNRQMYLYDRLEQRLTLISRGPDGLPGRGMSGMVQRYEGYYAELEIAANGSAVAFVSDAHSLLPGSQDGKPALKPACTYYPVAMVYPCRDVFLYDPSSGELDWVTRAAQPSIRQAHSALIPSAEQVLLEIAPPLLLIQGETLVRQTGGKRNVLAGVDQAGLVFDAVQAGEWVYVLGQEAILRAPGEGGAADVLRRFDPPARWGHMVSSADGEQAAFAVQIGTDGSRHEVWYLPRGEDQLRKVYDSGETSMSEITLAGLRADTLTLLPTFPYSAIMQIDLASGLTTTFEAGLDSSCCEAAISPDGLTLAVYHPQKGILLVDLGAAPPASETIPLPAGLSRAVGGFHWSPDGRSLYFFYSFLPQLPASPPFGIWRLDRDTLQVSQAAALENEWGGPAALSEDGQWYWLHVDLAGAAIAVNVQDGSQAAFPLPKGRVKIVRSQ